MTYFGVTHSEVITRMSHSFERFEIKLGNRKKCVRGALSEGHASDFDNNYQNQTHGPILLTFIVETEAFSFAI